MSPPSVPDPHPTPERACFAPFDEKDIGETVLTVTTDVNESDSESKTQTTQSQSQRLPDLTDQLIQHGVYDEYVNYRNNYLRWRQGNSLGARGSITDITKTAAENGDNVPMNRNNINNKINSQNINKKDQQQQQQSSSQIQQQDREILFINLYPTLASFKFRRTVAYWMLVTCIIGAWLFCIGGIFTYLGPFTEGEEKQLLGPCLIDWPNMIGIVYFSFSAYMGLVQHKSLVRSDRRRKRERMIEMKKMKRKEEKKQKKKNLKIQRKQYQDPGPIQQQEQVQQNLNLKLSDNNNMSLNLHQNPLQTVEFSVQQLQQSKNLNSTQANYNMAVNLESDTDNHTVAISIKNTAEPGTTESCELQCQQAEEVKDSKSVSSSKISTKDSVSYQVQEPGPESDVTATQIASEEGSNDLSSEPIIKHKIQIKSTSCSILPLSGSKKDTVTHNTECITGTVGSPQCEIANNFGTSPITLNFNSLTLPANLLIQQPGQQLQQQLPLGSRTSLQTFESFASFGIPLVQQPVAIRNSQTHRSSLNQQLQNRRRSNKFNNQQQNQNKFNSNMKIHVNNNFNNNIFDSDSARLYRAYVIGSSQNILQQQAQNQQQQSKSSQSQTQSQTHPRSQSIKRVGSGQSSGPGPETQSQQTLSSPLGLGLAVQQQSSTLKSPLLQQQQQQLERIPESQFNSDSKQRKSQCQLQLKELKSAINVMRLSSGLDCLESIKLEQNGDDNDKCQVDTSKLKQIDTITQSQTRNSCPQAFNKGTQHSSSESDSGFSDSDSDSDESSDISLNSDAEPQDQVPDNTNSNSASKQQSKLDKSMSSKRPQSPLTLSLQDEISLNLTFPPHITLTSHPLLYIHHSIWHPLGGFTRQSFAVLIMNLGCWLYFFGNMVCALPTMLRYRNDDNILPLYKPFMYMKENRTLYLITVVYPFIIGGWVFFFQGMLELMMQLGVGGGHDFGHGEEDSGPTQGGHDFGHGEEEEGDSSVTIGGGHDFGHGEEEEKEGDSSDIKEISEDKLLLNHDKEISDQCFQIENGSGVGKDDQNDIKIPINTDSDEHPDQSNRRPSSNRSSTASQVATQQYPQQTDSESRFQSQSKFPNNFSQARLKVKLQILLLPFKHSLAPWCASIDTCGGFLFTLGSTWMYTELFCDIIGYQSNNEYDDHYPIFDNQNCSDWYNYKGVGFTFFFGAICYGVSAYLGLRMWTSQRFGWGLFSQLNDAGGMPNYSSAPILPTVTGGGEGGPINSTNISNLKLNSIIPYSNLNLNPELNEITNCSSTTIGQTTKIFEGSNGVNVSAALVQIAQAQPGQGSIGNSVMPNYFSANSFGTLNGNASSSIDDIQAGTPNANSTSDSHLINPSSIISMSATDVQNIQTLDSSNKDTNNTNSTGNDLQLSRGTLTFNIVYTLVVTLCFYNIFFLLGCPKVRADAEDTDTDNNSDSNSQQQQHYSIIPLITQLFYQGILLLIVHLLLMLHSDMTSLPKVQPYYFLVLGLRLAFFGCLVIEIIELCCWDLEESGFWKDSTTKFKMRGSTVVGRLFRDALRVDSDSSDLSDLSAEIHESIIDTNQGVSWI